MGRGRRRVRRRKYDATVLTALVWIWEVLAYPCGQRLVAILRREVGRLRRFGELRSSEVVAGKLEQISAKTIDRLLEREKEVRQPKRERNPSVHPWLYQKVPVKVASEWDTAEVGNVQVDYENDNAWVEQKNWTHVRKVVGYRRYDAMRQVALDRQLEPLRRELFELADAKLPVILRRRQRGPDIVLGRRREVSRHSLEARSGQCNAA